MREDGWLTRHAALEPVTASCFIIGEKNRTIQGDFTRRVHGQVDLLCLY